MLRVRMVHHVQERQRGCKHLSRLRRTASEGESLRNQRRDVGLQW
jgi:hypothetical protein